MNQLTEPFKLITQCMAKLAHAAYVGQGDNQFFFDHSPNGTTQSLHKNMMILKFLALQDDFKAAALVFCAGQNT